MDVSNLDERDLDEAATNETLAAHSDSTRRGQSDMGALLAESRRQELALLDAERGAAERVAWAQRRLARWERRLARAEQRVAQWRRRRDMAVADLRFQQEARAKGPSGGWQSPEPVRDIRTQESETEVPETE